MTIRTNTLVRKSWLNPIKACIQLSPIIVILLLLPTLALISFLYWFFVALPLSLLHRSYGKFIGYHDNWVDENFCNLPPRSSLVVTMTIDGPISLPTLKHLFVNNVLHACIPNGKTRRYPKLQQYLSSFMGFRIWKKDSTFNISKHIIQRDLQCWLPSNKQEQAITHTLNHIHEKLINETYPEKQSPWEIILLPYTIPYRGNSIPQSIIAARIHHIVGDEKSIISLFLHSLGQQPLRIVQEHKTRTRSLWDSFLYHLCFVPNCINCLVDAIHVQFTSHSHPWKIYNFWKDKHSQFFVRFSSPLAVQDITQVADMQGVSRSSVIMSIVAGAIRNCDVDGLGGRDVAIAYTMPKQNPPLTLTNHGQIGILSLPTSVACPLRRVYQCHEILTAAMDTEMGKMLEIHLLTAGLLIRKWSRHMTINRLIPLGITEISDDLEGFSVGGIPCSEFLMSTGTLQGVMGVRFCALSYKDAIRIEVTAKESVLSGRQVDKLARDCEMELEILKAIVNERKYAVYSQ